MAHTAGRPAGGAALEINSGRITRALKTSEHVARNIVDDVVTRGLRTGDRLPSEAAMVVEYDVSRESLREALRLLEVQGLIRLRRGPGGGPEVGYLDPTNLGRTSTLYYHLAGGTHADLFEAWELSESVLAGRAARNDDRDAVRAAMEPFCLDHDAAPDDRSEGEGGKESAEEHTLFHQAVASLAQNRVLEVMLQTSGLIVTHHLAVSAEPPEAFDDIRHGHAEVARAIIAGDATRAGELMAAHINDVATLFGARMGDRINDNIDWR